MFEKTLSDVVKGIRASKRDTGLYISQCIAEIKTELNSTDLYVKANALQKLTFLQMMGYSMTWASFATIEVMSSPRFAHKRIGYLAASQGFTQNTEVILLTTNLLKKELRGCAGNNMQGVYEAGLAVNCISNIVTEDLARDLLPELTTLTTHPQPYLRKKAILCLFKVFVKYPQGLRLTFANIQQALDDHNPSVVSCAVNVITELSDKNPTNYLHLAPAFFNLLTNSTNNWMLIKVVKLLGSLVPEEPRLARKLLEPLAAIVRSTQAKSLLFEAVHTLTLSLPYCRKSDGTMPASIPDIVALCANTLRTFIEEPDQNLKYLGLVGFGSLVASHPKVPSAPEYRPLILKCLSDEDVTIRTRALDLLRGMATRKNLQELVSQLLTHVQLATGSYKHDLVLKILEMCSGEKYALVSDFGWYLDILWTLAHMRGIDTHAELLQQQVTDVALRVLPVRPYAVQQSIQVLMEQESSQTGGGTTNVEDNGRGKHVMIEILPSVAWIVGEYSDLIQDANGKGDTRYNGHSKGTYHSLVQALMAPSNIRKLPTTTHSVYVQAAMKVFAAATAQTKVSSQELEACVETLSRYLPVYKESTDVEVQERAFTANELLRCLNLSSTLGDVPGVAAADSDDDEADDGNLLGMMESSKSKSSSGGISSASSLAGRCRAASETLNYLLKPEPMKPTGAKAQRKKRHAPIGVDIDIDAPVDLSVFASFIEEELSRRPGGAKLSMESVSFTQQRPLRAAESQTVPIGAMDIAGIPGEMPPPASSFQHAGMPDSAEGSALTSQLNRQHHDPFYLNSGAPSETEDANPNRFGTIQLLDSDGNDSDDGGRKRRKKKKKRHKEKAHKSSALGDADFAMLTMTDTSIASKPASAAMNVTIFTSDDDDEDDDDQRLYGKKKTSGKEFAGLAKVDLTVPLREDEVMPQQQHRVVPERRAEEPPSKSSPKKAKKKKARKKDKETSQTPSAGGVGDLLDLGGFMPVAEVSSAVAASPKAPAITAPGENLISSAFDDLLGLSAPAEILPSVPMEDIMGMSPAAKPTKTPKGKRVWMKATIKTTHADGSPVVDWSKVALHFRVQAKEEGTAAVTFRVENNMETTALNNVTLNLKGQDAIAIGNVNPGESIESNKAGPFAYEKLESSMDMKGSLVTPECKVSIKMTLPATMFLKPLSGLSQEDVMKELSSSQWSSHSVKLEAENPAKVKPLVCSFLHAAEVDGGGSTPLMGTLAAQSSNSGSKVLVLVKIKGTAAKLDLKCSNEALGKALASDLKKLVV